jgi:HEPN domain-containing protein
MRPETAPWWEQADLETARVTQAAGRYYATSMFAQQAAEKGLKALYIEQRGVLAPRTHDLAFLGGDVGVPLDIATDIGVVNPAFDMVRYPDPDTLVPPVNAVDAPRAAAHLAAAERILTWVGTQLP